MGLKFQMRYSVPLFVSGKGIGPNRTAKNRAITRPPANLSSAIVYSSKAANAGWRCEIKAQCMPACRK